MQSAKKVKKFRDKTIYKKDAIAIDKTFKDTREFAHPFEPVIDSKSTILIIGSFPSLKSFENNFYYAHPKNQFWRLIALSFGKKEPKSLEEKMEFLQKNHIALWDVIKSCKRENSLDSNLKNITANDLKSFLKIYDNIKKIFFTSKTAQIIYEREFKEIKLPKEYLPSPSPAFAKMSFDQKSKIWKEVLKEHYA